jgi:hypothetical protein
MFSSTTGLEMGLDYEHSNNEGVPDLGQSWRAQAGSGLLRHTQVEKWKRKLVEGRKLESLLRQLHPGISCLTSTDFADIRL